MSKRTRRRIAAGIKRGRDKPKATPSEQGFTSPSKRVTDETEFPAGVASYHFLTDPEINAAKVIAEYWISHAEGVIWWTEPSVAPRSYSAAVIEACKQAKLTERQTEALLLSIGEGLSLQQIAAEIGVTKASAQDRLTGAWKKLKAGSIDSLSLVPLR